MIAAGASVVLTPEDNRSRWRPPRWLRRAAGPVTLLAAWSVASTTGLLPPEVLASPSDVAAAGGRLLASGELVTAIGVSGQRVGLGFALGTAVAVVLALLAGLFRLGEDLIDSSVGMIRTIPWVGLIPLLIIWLGIDEAPKVALVALAVTFPLYFNLYGGIRSVDAALIEAGRVLGMSRAGLVRHVVLPAAAPSALVGLRYALGGAWLALVFGEQVNASAGIGYLMNNAREFYRTDVIVVCLVVYAALGLFCDLVVRLAGRHLLTWRDSFDGT